MHTFVPENISEAQWHNVGNGIHVLGIKDKAKTRNGSEVVVVDEKFAMARKHKNGYEYMLNKTAFSGLEATKELAIDKVNDLYLSAMEANEVEVQKEKKIL